MHNAELSLPKPPLIFNGGKQQQAFREGRKLPKKGPLQLRLTKHQKVQICTLKHSDQQQFNLFYLLTQSLFLSFQK